MAGFRSAAFWLGVSASPVATQAGYKTPLPLPGFSAPVDVVQAGYRTALPLPGFSAVTGIEIAIPIPSTGGDSRKIRKPGKRPDLYQQARQEDEEIIAIAMAFLKIN